MKQILSMILATALTLSLFITPAWAMEYSVDGADAGTFGHATSVEPVTTVDTQERDNVDRSKNAALIPPPFGSPSADTPDTGEPLTPNLTNATPLQVTVGGGTASAGSAENSVAPFAPSQPDAITVTSNKFTLPDGLYYSDGSLGTLKIPTLGLTVKVYETESLESLAKGAGHFKSTSCWDGNVGIAGHNWGVTNHFGKIHTLKQGDRITYTTKLGTRSYEVYFVGQISETDFSRLGRTSGNIITLITCVRDVRDMRWCVQAREV